jgi:hypothetical protein
MSNKKVKTSISAYKTSNKNIKVRKTFMSKIKEEKEIVVSSMLVLIFVVLKHFCSSKTNRCYRMGMVVGVCCLVDTCLFDSCFYTYTANSNRNFIINYIYI